MPPFTVLLPWLLAGAATAAAVRLGRAHRAARRELAALREAATRGETAPSAAAAPAAPAAPAAAEPDVHTAAARASDGRLDELLRRSEHLASLGRMLAGAAHELNNPLAAVCGFAQLLLRGQPRDEDRQALETIDHEARRAAAIVRDLLTFSRGQGVGTRRLVDLNGVAHHIAQTRRYALETSGVQLALELTDGPLEVLGDRTQLEQVLHNLVANAAQALEGALEARGGVGAAGPAPRVVVRTARLERVALLEVEDNGPGILAAHLPLIWDPFFTTKGEQEGTGLGLAVVHRLVQDHAGAIDVESAEGAGARFRVALPLPTPAQAASAAPAADAGPPPHPLDVLVVGAGDGAAEFVARYLSTRGHAVLTADGVEHALRLAEWNDFDVVVAAASAAAPDLPRLPELRARATRGATRFVIAAGADEAPDAPAPLGPVPGAGALDGWTRLATPYEIEPLRRAVEGA